MENDYDKTIARMAGNIAAGMVQGLEIVMTEDQLVEAATRIAFKIVAKVKQGK